MNPRPADRHPRLRRLFAAYVNQDWDSFGPFPEDAVRRYAKDVSATDRRAAVAEIESLLAASRTEAGLAKILASLRCGYAPDAHGRTYRQFLESVRDVLGVKG